MPSKRSLHKKGAPSRTQMLEAKDKRYVWHPFTQMQEWVKEELLIIQKGKGSWLEDTQGKRYLDGVSSLWCNVHGHQVKEIDRAVKAQLKEIAHSTFLGLSHPGAIELAEKLVQLAPKGLERVFYSDSGSEAVEIALKIAFQYCQQSGQKRKTRFARLSNAYHGDTLGSVSVGGIELFHEIYKPLLFESFEIPAPYQYRWPGGDDPKRVAREALQKMEEVFQNHHEEIAAFIMEPLMQGAAGMIHHFPGYLAHARELTRKYNILLILDEVATGFGRTGTMFACEQEAVSPDILIVAKGITGGYLPLAATLVTDKIYQAFLGRHEDLKTFFHGHTYTANPLACSAALASLDLFKKNKILAKNRVKINWLQKRLQKFYSISIVGDIRQAGFMVGIELVRNKETKEPFAVADKIGVRVIQKARRKGAILRPLGNVIVLMPPLSISKEELSKLLAITQESIEEVAREI